MGFVAVLGLACAGIPVYFLPRFRPDEVLDAIEQRRASIFIGVPAMYRMLLEAGAERRDLSSVRIWGSGADAMPADLAAKFKQIGATANLPIVGPVGEALFFEGYGMVETGGGAAVKASPPMLEHRTRRVARLSAAGLQVPCRRRGRQRGRRRADRRAVAARPGRHAGYWGDAAATDATLTDDGWLRTGDLARKGMLGTVVFAGRKKDVIKNGGYSVYALEVERALEEHPDVLEAAVVGLPDERRGEVPGAVIRVAPGKSVQADELIAWAGERLASYKVPRRIVFADDLPRTGTRKVQKSELLIPVRLTSDPLHQLERDSLRDLRRIEACG